MNEVSGSFSEVCVNLCETEDECLPPLPLDFLKEEMVQEMHWIASHVSAFAQGAFTQG